MKKGAAKIRIERKGKTKSMPSTDIADLITQKEAARLRGVTLAAVGDLIKRGRLSYREMFGKKLVYRNEVDQFEKQQPGPKRKG